MNDIDKYISEKNYTEALGECVRNNYNYLGTLLSYAINNKEHLKIFKNNINGFQTEGKEIDEENDSQCETNNLSLLEIDDNKIRVKMLCNWMSSEQLREYYNKFSTGNYEWNNICLVLDNDPDYFVVINSPPKGENPDPKKTIVFQMEPNMEKNISHWGEWATPDKSKFLKVFDHKVDYNNNEWHLSKTYKELKTMEINKNSEYDSVISSVLSEKYHDPGHIKRVDFVKFLEKKGVSVHVYGNNKWEYKDYKGSLPIYNKDNALFPYKYVFNCENNSIKNYYTEKLVDAILSESLCFYSGCFNIRDYIDDRAYVYLELSNFEEDYKKVKAAIDGKLWEERIEIIREEKKKILDYLSFFPRLERIIKEVNES